MHKAYAVADYHVVLAYRDCFGQEVGAGQVATGAVVVVVAFVIAVNAKVSSTHHYVRVALIGVKVKVHVGLVFVLDCSPV